MRMQKFASNRYINRGLLSIAAYLKSREINVTYFTLETYYLDGIYDFNNIIERLLEIIHSDDFHLVAISNMFFAEFPYCVEIAKRIKKSFPEKYIVMGGYFATFYSEYILKHYSFVDIVVRGEGEWALFELIRHLTENGTEHLNRLKGITYNHEKFGIVVASPLPHSNLKKLPVLNYNLLPDGYLDHKNPPNINIEFNRGCYFKCSFCTATLFWGEKVRSHDLNKVITELEQLSSLGYQGSIGFEDETIDLKATQFKQFLEKISRIERNYIFDYVVTRYDFVDTKSLQLLNKVGFREVVIGLESASKKILQQIDKRIDLIKFKECCRKISEHGLNLNIFLIIGLPGETEQTFEETYQYISDLVNEGLVANIMMSHFQPYQCTKAYDDLQKCGGRLRVSLEDYSEWIMRGRPLVEYPHLSAERLQEMYNAFDSFNWNSHSQFVTRF